MHEKRSAGTGTPRTWATGYRLGVADVLGRIEFAERVPTESQAAEAGENAGQTFSKRM